MAFVLGSWSERAYAWYMDIRVLSIGALSGHPLWDERGAVRTGHMTTTLVRTGGVGGVGGAVIVVDPGLPGQMIEARLAERAGIGVSDVTHVFLTSFNPEGRRGIGVFEHAKWLISPTEREAVGVPLAQSLGQLAQSKAACEERGEEFPEDERVLMEMLVGDVELLSKIEAAPDSIAPGVDLFPLAGVSAGTCGLLVSEATSTTLICGDAVATVEHLMAGQVLEGADRKAAMGSFAEAVEIADYLVLGRDNMVHNTVARGSPVGGNMPKDLL